MSNVSCFLHALDYSSYFQPGLSLCIFTETKQKEDSRCLHEAAYDVASQNQNIAAL